MLENTSVTLLIYMAADNNLDSSAMKDLESIKKASIESNMDIIVQLDRRPIPDTRVSFRYHYKNGKKEKIKELWEINSGCPTQLKAFIEESVSAYPSDKLIVIVWSHGSGIDDRNIYTNEGKKDYSKVKRFKLFKDKKELDSPEPIGIAYDDTSKDFLDNLELKKALTVSKKIDIIGFDACLMGMFEIAYQLKNQATVMVGSQHLEPSSGWDYPRILKDLEVKESSHLMGKQLVEFYVNSDEHPSTELTQSAYNLKIVDKVAQELDSFAKVLLANIKEKSILEDIFLDTQWFHRNDYIDLIDFIKKMKPYLKERALEHYGEKLLYKLEQLVIANHTKGKYMQEANGVSIYFPSQKYPNIETFEMYEKLDFSKDYPNWVKLLKWYWST